MAIRSEKNADGQVEIVMDGWEQGIAPSPHKGIANIQNANISTELGEVVCSFNRFQETAISDASGTGSLAFADSSHVSLTLSGNTSSYFKGMWITVTASTHGGELANGDYYVLPSTGSNYQLSATFNGAAVTGFTTGLTASFTFTKRINNPIAYTTEQYFNSSGTVYHRYYVLDSAGYVWVYDSQNEVTYDPVTDKFGWFLPYKAQSAGISLTVKAGITVLNGWLIVFGGGNANAKPTVRLDGAYSAVAGLNFLNTTAPHYALSGHNGRCYYTDGNYIGSLFPDTTINNGTVNIQSYCSWVVSDTAYGTATVVSGIPPTDGKATSSFRVPVYFFTATGGTLPSSITADTIYYVSYTINNGPHQFQVYAAATGGSAIADLATGASGIQYFNTFYPIGAGGGAYGTAPTFTYSPQRVNLPSFETAQFLVELGNNVLIGCSGNTVYPWNQVDVTPSGLINLPEGNVQQMLTVNQMAYIFAGNQGNVYITDGSTASLVINIPDYVAGVPGSPGTYIESTYTWGGTMYLRGRVYFSVLDQTTSKTGNCGGIWSFVPTQNLYIGQDTGIGLRLEAQNSYASYNGTATLLIPRQTQTAQTPLYWSAWYSSVTSATYGIDYSGTGTNAASVAVVETDAIPLGTMLDKKTWQQLEYKLGSPLDTGATVTAKYRTNITDTWTALPSFQSDPSKLSAFCPVNFQQVQWAQFQFTLTPITSTASTNTFIRFREARLR